MTHLEIINAIKSGKVAPFYVLHGLEPYFIDVISDFIEEHLLTESERPFNQVVFYGRDVTKINIVDEARQFPMMASRRVVIIKEAQDVKDLFDLEPYLSNPSPQSVVVFCYKYKKIDKRSKFAKVAAQNGVMFESEPIKDYNLAQWVSSYVSSKQYAIKQDGAEMIAQYLGNDLSKVINELDKIILLLPKSGTITTQLIQEQIGISKDYNVFELQKALSSRNFEQARLIFDYFGINPKTNPAVVVISTLYGYFNKVYIARYHAKKSDQDLFKLLGIPTMFFLKDYREAARNYSGEHLQNLFFALREADKHSKGIGSRHGDETAIFKDLLIAFMHPQFRI